MCGIAGLYSSVGDPVSAASVQRMCDLLRHRGPDDQGLWVEGPVGLGHRRLSIIDLSARGRCPLPNEDGALWLIFNGEVYNFRELRRELGEKGHQFRSDTDCEVVVHLYEEVGPACVSRLNGMFAFALWDVAERRLFLARDRYGVKPLYYTWLGTTLAFASEVKAFLALPDFRASADPLALTEHLTFQNTIGERTLFQGVRLLGPGQCLTCDSTGNRTHQYWDLGLEPDAGPSLAEWAARLREVFEQAVVRQLMSDVPLGSFLSGGMDTGAISAVAAALIPRMHTFTCGFELPPEATEIEKSFDERQESRQLAHQLGTRHHELELTAEAMATALPRVVWHLDEPRVGISYQILYTMELIRRHVTVVLSGVGGDELFAGYPWRYEPLLDMQPMSFERDYYRHWVRLLSDEEKANLFTASFRRQLGDISTFDVFRQALEGSKGHDPLDRALHFDFRNFLPGLLLVDDKLSMAHAVETRVPFLDNDLVELVSQVPCAYKLQRGRSKLVLKRAMAGLLSAETLARPKQGFTPPEESWYRHRAMPMIRALLLGERALERGFFEPRTLALILDDHLHGRRNHRQLIWSLQCFEWWNRLFVDREPLPAIPETASVAGVQAARQASEGGGR
jgi:asparagine synthase (glutamine-hydrolysing)